MESGRNKQASKNHGQMLPVHMEFKKQTSLEGNTGKKHKNAWNVRNELNIKSVRMRTEKRILERIRHVARMPENRTTKKVVLGWTKMTEKVEGNLKRTRNTSRYWMKLTKEAGWRRLGNEPRKRRKKRNKPKTTNAVRKR